MKKTKLIALSGIIAAASVVAMLLAYVPWFTYCCPALAGCFLIFLVFEANKKHAFVVYIIVGILSFFICEKEAAISYILFFGYYPILKAILERIPSRVVEWIIKVLIFNATFAGIFLLETYVFGIDTESLGDFGKYSAITLAVAANLMFVIYDIALTKLVALYAAKYRDKIKKYIG